MLLHVAIVRRAALQHVPMPPEPAGLQVLQVGTLLGEALVKIKDLGGDARNVRASLFADGSLRGGTPACLAKLGRQRLRILSHGMPPSPAGRQRPVRRPLHPTTMRTRESAKPPAASA